MEASARREIERAKATMLARIAAAIERDAQRFVPVDTGHLRSRIEAYTPVGDSVEVHARTDYAGYVELGTRHMQAQPYLAQALYRQRVI